MSNIEWYKHMTAEQLAGIYVKAVTKDGTASYGQLDSGGVMHLAEGTLHVLYCDDGCWHIDSDGKYNKYTELSLELDPSEWTWQQWSQLEKRPRNNFEYATIINSRVYIIEKYSVENKHLNILVDSDNIEIPISFVNGYYKRRVDKKMFLDRYGSLWYNSGEHCMFLAGKKGQPGIGLCDKMPYSRLSKVAGPMLQTGLDRYDFEHTAHEPIEEG